MFFVLYFYLEIFVI